MTTDDSTMNCVLWLTPLTQHPLFAPHIDIQFDNIYIIPDKFNFDDRRFYNELCPMVDAHLLNIRLFASHSNIYFSSRHTAT